jgi:competence protein ComEA
MKQFWKISVILTTLATNLVLPSVYAADKAASTGATSTTVASVTNTATINVNTASVEQLATIKGLGPKKAQAIIDYRQQNGSFKTVADLGNVPGIGDKLLASITPYVNANPA